MPSTRSRKRRARPKAPSFPFTLAKEPVKLTLSQLCTLYGVTIEVNKRTEDVTWALPIYATIRWLEVLEVKLEPPSAIYVSPCGDGNTMKQALRSLASQLSESVVRVTTYEMDKTVVRELQLPQIIA